jgi:uncharacterized membrane protein
MSSWAPALALVGAVAYAVLCHALMTYAAGTPWAVIAVLGPLIGVTAALAARARQWLLVAGCVIVAAGLLVLVPRGGLGDPTRLYLAQHAGVHAAMGVAFAATLRQPLSMIGQFAQRVHTLTPAMVAYTRKVTVSWIAYFFGMAATSVLVHAFASREAWSLLANLLTPVIALSLFFGEYLLRYRLHPEFERVSIAEAIRAYRSHRADAAAPAATATEHT